MTIDSDNPSPAYTLTEEDKAHFLTHGYVRIPNCFSPEKAAEWTSNVWTRLGFSPTDKTTWTKERVNMPRHRVESVRTFAPKAWAAICELCGGEDRVAEEFSTWGDGLIVNLGTDEWEGRWPDPRDLDNWHVDGDFFVHYLDSPEQALLVIPLFTEIKEHGGGTMICPEAIPLIAKHLYDHPEGVSPGMAPRGQEVQGFYRSTVRICNDFREMTGNVGDVVLMHPFMCHSASKNSLRTPRIITNPPVGLKAPFNFDRDDPSQYSLVEKKTLLALGKDRLAGWHITTDRERIIPARLKAAREMKNQELERMGLNPKEGERVHKDELL
ncbi:hypothetical protein FE257_009111 [Aspergillus nanangensis]|uniref:Phytanoyl-CoA dioxygenase n=1 Tax=Aspergillus nanangensis TaxID=2582783 RepID=A0AAD4CYI2_ASPNN|nr:hypothetical protein FE257_009111 [Aspergillus nanangensis]